MAGFASVWFVGIWGFFLFVFRNLVEMPQLFFFLDSFSNQLLKKQGRSSNILSEGSGAQAL